MARKPKGSIIQPLPSWNLRQMVAGSITGGQVGVTFEDMGLFNSAKDGSYLVIWDMTVAISPYLGTTTVVPTVTGQIIVGTQGKPFGVSQPQGYNILQPGPQSPGWLWDNTTPSGLTTPVYTFLLGPGVWTWPHDWPFAALPPGSSYACELFGNTENWSISFTWEMVRQL